MAHIVRRTTPELAHLSHLDPLQIMRELPGWDLHSRQQGRWNVYLKSTVVLVCLLSGVSVAQVAPWTFDWTLDPLQPPQAWVAPSSPLVRNTNTTGWDVLRHIRGVTNPYFEPSYEPFMAHHNGAGGSPACGQSDSPLPPTTLHQVTTVADTTYLCVNHLMTGTFSSEYAETSLTPDVMMDWSTAPATVTWNVSTWSPPASIRDWIDVVLSDFGTFFPGRVEPTQRSPLGCPQVPGVDFQGYPKRSLVIDGRTRSYFNWQVVGDDFCMTPELDSFSPLTTELMAVSTVNRSKFTMTVSNVGSPATATHLVFGIDFQSTNPWSPSFVPQGGCPPVVPPESGPFCHFDWINTNIPLLPFTRGVISWAHHSYNPYKIDETGLPCDGGECIDRGPNSWHWSHFTIDRAVPFTILNGNIQWCHGKGPCTVTFLRQAPPNSTLRFEATGSSVQYSYTGAVWFPAVKAPVAPAFLPDPGYGIVYPYITPITAGITSIMLRSSANEYLRDIAIWAP